MEKTKTEPSYKWPSKHPEPLPGTVYNEWTVVEDYQESNKTLHDKILARCSCGEEREVWITNLIYSQSQSCGHDQYKEDRTEIEKRKNYYPNRIGEVIDGFTLQRFERNDTLRTFTITCPNGHDHTRSLYSDPIAFIRHMDFKCWCQIDDPITRMRYRKGLSLREIGELFDLTRERIRQYEVALRNKKPLTKKRHGRTNEQMYLDDYRFQRLSIAFNLNEREQNMWIDEILYNRFYEYDEPKRMEFVHKKSES